MPLKRSAEHRVKLRRDISEERAPRHGARSLPGGVTRCAHLSSLRLLQRFVRRLQPHATFVEGTAVPFLAADFHADCRTHGLRALYVGLPAAKAHPQGSRLP